MKAFRKAVEIKMKREYKGLSIISLESVSCTDRERQIK